MTRKAVVIEGAIVLDAPRTLTGASAEVQLRARAMTDAPAPLVARADVPILAGEVDRLPFRLEAQVDDEADYVLGAEIRLGGGDRLRPGDLLTTVQRSWRAGTQCAAVLKVKPIS